ncbi:MAG TPA: hypothetical protein PK629_10975 [Oscillospiraceae bacterium]|nr:hypothetical protein [Oscillospiraceae bacterium]HPF55986.1 hypothetical protein [Clostridiales bacterium]HPK36220.1 hypothetical protein [Oscillospiraceae bacterium]HPR75711.1 hypothetical protein [Oscillospiraceae bacterium]
MKKTRILALTMALVMAVVMFAGCGGNEESSEESSYVYSMPSVSTTVVKKAEKWTAEVGDVEGWVPTNISENVFYYSEAIDNDSVAFMQFVEKLADGRTLDDVMQDYIDDVNASTLYTNVEWVIETPQKTTFGGKESYEISVNYSIQTRAARHYHIIFTQLDDEVFIYNNNYTIRNEARDETLIDNLMDAVTFVPMA